MIPPFERVRLLKVYPAEEDDDGMVCAPLPLKLTVPEAAVKFTASGKVKEPLIFNTLVPTSRYSQEGWKKDIFVKECVSPIPRYTQLLLLLVEKEPLQTTLPWKYNLILVPLIVMEPQETAPVNVLLKSGVVIDTVPEVVKLPMF